MNIEDTSYRNVEDLDDPVICYEYAPGEVEHLDVWTFGIAAGWDDETTDEFDDMLRARRPYGGAVFLVCHGDPVNPGDFVASGPSLGCISILPMH